MGDAIGQMLPSAVAIAAGPMQIIAIVLILVTPRGRVNGLAFILGWLLGLAVLGAIVLVASGEVEATERGEPATWVAIVQFALGGGLLYAGVRSWRGRPRGDAQPKSPKWMSSLDDLSTVKAFATGTFLSSLNGKNTLLAIAGALAIAETGIGTGEQAVAYAIFMLVATMGVGTPVLLTFALGDRSRTMLDDLKDWMIANSSAVMAVVFGLLGVMILGDGLTSL